MRSSVPQPRHPAKGKPLRMTAEYIRTVAGSPSPADEIAKSKALFDEGTITAEEYEKLRARALQ